MPALSFAFLHPRSSVVLDVDPRIVDRRGRDDLVVLNYVHDTRIACADSGPRAQGSNYKVIRMCLECSF
jgi:hypothetical protein